MPFSYQIDTSRRVVVVKATGMLTNADMDALSQALAADGAYDRAWPVLVDATDVHAGGVDTRTILERASRVDRAPARRADGRVAISASADAVYGMARMFQMLTEGAGSEVGVFRTVAEAEEWLGIASANGG